ncbi:MAG: hypothetical protein IKI15_12220 [Lachnospiraceae bacterium]|nr:hypothetical protein [Lachnospiraceae bacterium]
MKALYKYRFVLIGVFALFAMLWITCGTSQARGPVPTATPEPTATPTPTLEGWIPDDTYQPTSGEKVRMIWHSLYNDPESGYAGYDVDNWDEPKEVILVLTKDADREAILREWPDDVKLQIIDAKYTWRELDAVRHEINRNWDYSFGTHGDENIVIGTGMTQRENYVTVAIDRTASARIQKKVIADLFERYGDCIRVDASWSLEELEATYECHYTYDMVMAPLDDSDAAASLAAKTREAFYNYKPDTSLLTYTEYVNNRSAYQVMSRGAAIALAVGLGIAIIAFAYVLRRQNARVAALANGRTVMSGTYSDAEIEALAKSAGGDVSDAGREKIFAAYERERDNR